MSSSHYIKAMEEFKKKYEEFHKQLIAFMNVFTSRLHSTARDDFQHADAIAHVMPSNDPSFGYYSADAAVEKYFIVQALTHGVLDRSAPLVHTDHEQWFNEQAGNLKWAMGKVQLGITTARLDGASSVVFEISAGIGGINDNIKNSMDKTAVTRLTKLLDFLNTPN